MDEAAQGLRFAAFDLDGTLLDPRGRPLDGVADGVRSLRDKGILPLIVSGRSHLGLSNLDLVDFLAIWDEQVLLNDGDVMFDRSSGAIECRVVLPATTMSRLLAVGEKDFVVECRGRHHASSRRAALAFGMAFELPRAGIELGLPSFMEPTRVVVFESGPDLASTLDGWDAEVSTIGAFGATVLRPVGGGKAAGLAAHLAKRFGEPDLSRVIAFGDGDNDAELLSSSAVGVAVQHSTPAAVAGASMHLGESLSEFLAGFDPALVGRSLQ